LPDRSLLLNRDGEWRSLATYEVARPHCIPPHAPLGPLCSRPIPHQHPGCSIADPKIRLLCDGMTWNPIGVCSGQQVCDPNPGPNQGLCVGPPVDAQAVFLLVDAAGGRVALYTPCPSLGALNCCAADPKIQVMCDGMLWRPIGTCTGQLTCDPVPGPNLGLCVP
jgi:hypothetical protein